MGVRVSPRFPALRCIIVSRTMNRLASILPAAQVLVSVDVTSKKRAFEEAGLLFESLHGLSRALITDSLFARERLGSPWPRDRKSTRLNSSHSQISYAVFCLKKK